MVLGADLGSALAVRILFLDLSLLPPALMVAGFTLYMASTRWRIQCMGRILVGLGLMLLGLGWIREAIAPLVASPVSPAWQDVLASVPWIGAVALAGLTWLGHSSVAAVLVIATVDQAGVLPASVTVAMLLGANVGAALIAVPMVSSGTVSGRTLVYTNLLFRCAVSLPLLLMLEPLLALEPFSGLLLDQKSGARIITAHIAINLAVVVICLPLAGLVSRWIQNILEQRRIRREDALTRSVGADLDRESLTDTHQVLISARREALRLGDAAETLFARSLDLFDAKDQAEVHRMVALDAEINARNKVIHHYLSAARGHVSSPDDERALDQILHFSASMEDIGDAVSHDFARLALKALDRGISFSVSGRGEIRTIHEQVGLLLREEINQFADKASGRSPRSDQLARSIRKLCRTSIANHRQRLSSSLPESIASSSIHQDLVRDLMQLTMLFQQEDAV